MCSLARSLNRGPGPQSFTRAGSFVRSHSIEYISFTVLALFHSVRSLTYSQRTEFIFLVSPSHSFHIFSLTPSFLHTFMFGAHFALLCIHDRYLLAGFGKTRKKKSCLNYNVNGRCIIT